jgi:hypothetical protein
MRVCGVAVRPGAAALAPKGAKKEMRRRRGRGKGREERRTSEEARLGQCHNSVMLTSSFGTNFKPSTTLPQLRIGCFFNRHLTT